jgi:hypothetical protein
MRAQAGKPEIFDVTFLRSDRFGVRAFLGMHQGLTCKLPPKCPITNQWVKSTLHWPQSVRAQYVTAQALTDLPALLSREGESILG